MRCYGCLFLRQKHGPTARIVLCRVDVKNDYRQGLVDPAGAVPVFGYTIGDYVVGVFFLQFRWCYNPRFWGLMASALEHAHTHSTVQDTAVFIKGRPPSIACSSPRGGGVRSVLSLVVVDPVSDNGGYVEPVLVRAAQCRLRHSCRGAL